MTQKIESFLLSLLQAKNALPTQYDIDAFSYIDSGYVKPSEIMQFALDIEAKFSIAFTASDIQSPAFNTLGGLIRLIDSKTKTTASKTALNKIPGRHYWKYFLKQQDFSKALFYPTELDIDAQIALFKKHVCIVNLETSTYCNRKCPYCPTPLSAFRKTQAYMKEAVFNKIVSELSTINYASTVCLNLYNEPLADESIYHKIKQLRKNLPNAFLMFNSNGDYANAEKLDKLNEAGLNALFITLHAPAHKPYTPEDRIKDFRKFFNKIGLDANQCEISQTIENDHIESNVNWKGVRLRIMANNWSKYGTSRGGSINTLNASTQRTSPCVRPLREMFISHSGDIFPCCELFPDDLNNQPYLVDNVAAKSIFAIYASHTLASWRKHLFTFGEKTAPCESCLDQDFAHESSSALRRTILSGLAAE